MKALTATLFVALLSLGTASDAEAAHYQPASRIYRTALATGQLTPAENRSLQRSLNRIRSFRTRALLDGRLSRVERRKLNRMERAYMARLKALSRNRARV